MGIIAPPVSVAAILRLNPRRQVVCTRGRFPINVDGGGGTNYTRFESYIFARTGAQPCANLQVAYCNRQAATSGEVPAAGADYTLEGSLTYPTTMHALFWGGRKNPVVSAGAGFVLSDPLGVTVPPDSLMTLRSAAIVAPGELAVVGQPANQLYAGTRTTATASQVYTNASWTNNGGVAAGFGFTPLCVLGVPERRHVAVLLWGDSITYGQGETAFSTDGHHGWAERGLSAVNGYSVPFVNASRSGDSSAGYVAPLSVGRRALLDYVTHAVFGMSTNDLGNSVPLATLQANCQAIWLAARRLGVRAYHTTMTPKTTSSDAWATAANQSVVATYESSGTGSVGIRGQFNAWLFAQVTAGNLDGVLDVNATVEDPAAPGKWRSGGGALTADGLHPNSAGHIAMAAAMNAAAATWRV